MTYLYASEPSWGYERDMLTEEEEARREARLNQLEALLDFVAFYGGEWDVDSVVFSDGLAHPLYPTEWAFGIFPDIEAVRDMYCDHRNNNPFGRYPETNCFFIEESVIMTLKSQ